MAEEIVRAFGPASLSNLGPGFDTLGMCLDGIGDTVEVRKTASSGIEISFRNSPFGQDISVDPDKNTAGTAARYVAAQMGYTEGLHLNIVKGFKPGSGIGSSAASAVAAAWAVNQLLGGALSKGELIEAVLQGESIASGARHGDNVLPALLGGLVLVSSQDPTRYRRISVPGNLWIVVILPEVQVLTKEARNMLPKTVNLRTAVNQASSLAFMVCAFQAGDWKEVGRWMMRDGIAEPVRATLVPCYNQIKLAAIEAGAYGCALTGSGPAMFAISDDERHASIIRQAMLEASHKAGVGATAYLSQVNQVGACETVTQDLLDI